VVSFQQYRLAIWDISDSDRVSQMIDLFWSAVSLLAFWLIGALIFSSIESWSYG
jgi:potassium channel subfamily K